MILAIGPDSIQPFQRYWSREKIPFIGLPDPNHTVAKQYKQEVNLFKLGRMPLNCVVDVDGQIRFVHYSAAASDIPDVQIFLNVIRELNMPSS